jgi:hypothetical protein
MMRRLTALALALAWGPIAQSVHAQALVDSAATISNVPVAFFPIEEADPDAAAKADDAAATGILPSYGAWVGWAKWISLGAAVGLGIYGFSVNSDAQARFDRLEALCLADPDNCRDRNPDGSYNDPILEQLYQDIVNSDSQARTALIAAQISFAVSVVLFIVDFQKGEGPGDIPYDPADEKSALRLTAVPGEIALRYYFR